MAWICKKVTPSNEKSQKVQKSHKTPQKITKRTIDVEKTQPNWRIKCGEGAEKVRRRRGEGAERCGCREGAERVLHVGGRGC